MIIATESVTTRPSAERSVPNTSDDTCVSSAGTDLCRAHQFSVNVHKQARDESGACISLGGHEARHWRALTRPSPALRGTSRQPCQPGSGCTPAEESKGNSGTDRGELLLPQTRKPRARLKRLLTTTRCAWRIRCSWREYHGGTPSPAAWRRAVTRSPGVLALNTAQRYSSGRPVSPTSSLYIETAEEIAVSER